MHWNYDCELAGGGIFVSKAVPSRTVNKRAKRSQKVDVLSDEDEALRKLHCA